MVSSHFHDFINIYLFGQRAPYLPEPIVVGSRGIFLSAQCLLMAISSKPFAVLGVPSKQASMEGLTCCQLYRLALFLAVALIAVGGFGFLQSRKWCCAGNHYQHVALCT